MYNYFLDPPNVMDDSVIKEDDNSISNKTGADTKQVRNNLRMMSQETQWIDIDSCSQELSNQSISSISISSQNL